MLGADEAEKMKQAKKRRKRGHLLKELRLAKTLVIVFVMFCICWAPYAFMCVADYADNWPKEVVTAVYHEILPFYHHHFLFQKILQYHENTQL